MMQNDLQQILSSMLSEWHLFCSHRHARSGYPGRAAGFGQSRSSSQYDWESGVESERVDKLIMEGFDAAVARVPEPWNLALHFEARNLAVRAQVWTSPRLPKDRQELLMLIGTARVKLLKELEAGGVLC